MGWSSTYTIHSTEGTRLFRPKTVVRLGLVVEQRKGLAPMPALLASLGRSDTKEGLAAKH